MLYIRHNDGSTLYEYNTTAESTEADLDNMTVNGGFATGKSGNANANCFDGQLDALAVFNRAFTKAELDGVFTNGWDGDGW